MPDALRQILTEHTATQDNPTKTVVILQVNIAARTFTVRADGVGILRNVQVSNFIDCGTVDNPRVFAGNRCGIKQQVNGKWVVIEYYATIRCAPDETPTANNSDFYNGFGKLDVTPFTPMPSQVLSMGEISLPDLRPPGMDTLLGDVIGPTTENEVIKIMTIPIDTSRHWPPLEGEVLKYDATLGVWYPGFRGGAVGCSGTMTLSGSLDWDNSANASIMSPVYVSGNNRYVFAVGQNITTRHWELHVIDITTPAAPTDAAYYTLTYWDGSFYTNVRALFIDGTTLYLYGHAQNAARHFIEAFDITTPITLSSLGTWTYDSNETGGFQFGKKINGTLYLALTVYNISAGTSGMRLLNLSAFPTVVSASYLATPDPDSVGPNWNFIKYDGTQYAYAVRESGYYGTVDSIDLSSPGSPSVVDTLVKSNYQYVPNGSALVGKTLWYSIQDTNSDYWILGVDVTSPTNLAAVASLNTSGIAYYTMTSNGSGCIAATSDYGIDTIGVTAPATPDISQSVTDDYANEVIDVYNAYLIHNGFNWSTRHPHLEIFDTL